MKLTLWFERLKIYCKQPQAQLMTITGDDKQIKGFLLQTLSLLFFFVTLFCFSPSSLLSYESVKVRWSNVNEYCCLQNMTWKDAQQNDCFDHYFYLNFPHPTMQNCDICPNPMNCRTSIQTEVALANII